MYAKVIKNRLTIIPIATDPDEYGQQLSNVTEFISGMEDGIMKSLCLTKIAPKPIELEANSREEDDWLISNWGVRDKAFNAVWTNETELTFDTYWNPVIPILQILADNFPKTDFVYEYASTNIGECVGECYVSQGELIPIDAFEDFAKYSYDVAFNLMPTQKEKYVFCESLDNYVYDVSVFNAEIERNGFYKGHDGEVLIGLDDKKKPLYDDVDDLPF